MGVGVVAETHGGVKLRVASPSDARQRAPRRHCPEQRLPSACPVHAWLLHEGPQAAGSYGIGTGQSPGSPRHMLHCGYEQCLSALAQIHGR
eukprot:6840366-Alexandrium_andersonii.AAC.1